jgi:flagellin
VSITPLSTTLLRPLASGERRIARATEQLSTGLRIVRARDDAAGLTVAERLRAQHRGLAVAERNARDGMSLTRTADGALGQLHDQLQRVRELAVQWSNGTLSGGDRAAIEQEAAQLGEQAAHLYDSTRFNGIAVLQGGTTSFQIGARDGDTIATPLADLLPLLEEDPFTFDQSATTTTTTGTPGGKATGWHKKNAGTTTTATPVTSGMDAIERIDWAIELVTQHRARMGAIEARLEHVVRATAIEREQLVAAESRIRDADMAMAATTLSRATILRQAQGTLLAQAQRLDRSRVLALLG